MGRSFVLTVVAAFFYLTLLYRLEKMMSGDFNLEISIHFLEFCECPPSLCLFYFSELQCSTSVECCSLKVVSCCYGCMSLQCRLQLILVALLMKRMLNVLL